jgi:hypothetical protein
MEDRRAAWIRPPARQPSGQCLDRHVERLNPVGDRKMDRASQTKLLFGELESIQVLLANIHFASFPAYQTAFTFPSAHPLSP